MISTENHSQLKDLKHAGIAVLTQSAREPQPVVPDDFELLNPLPDSILYRLFERSIAGCALLLTAPLFLALALLIRLQGRGPVFYTQTRVGRGERPFTIYKFRTMYTDAEADGPFICTSYSDPRITKLGSVLRKYKLDELPQLFNIFRGDMAFVGPRPERPHFHAEFASIPQWRQRTRVYPGLTGLAQASRWISHDPEEKLAADLVYLEQRSCILDLLLVLYTLAPKLRPSVFLGIKFN